MLRYLTAGESHGPQLTVIIEGLPAGLTVNIDQINHHLARRQKGYGRGGRMKIESDEAKVLSGLRLGVTLGSPVTIAIENRDWANWSDIMDPLDLSSGSQVREATCPRPGHADLAGGIKYNHYDLRNVLERASARETAIRVALGSLVRQILEYFDVRFASHVVRIGSVALNKGYDLPGLDKVVEIAESSEVRCIDKDTGDRMIAEIDSALQSGDSLGGVAELLVGGLPVGLGSYSQWDRRLDGRLAAALMSIPSAKAVEIGLGFESASRSGSEVHDQIYYQQNERSASKGFYRKSNNAGGLEGGITNGEDIVARVAVKPISTLNKPLDSVDVKTKKPTPALVERADCCVVPAVAVISEAVAALVLTDAFLEKFGSDNLKEIERNYRAFLATPY